MGKKAGWTRVPFGDVVRLCNKRSHDPMRDGLKLCVGLEHLDSGDPRVHRWGSVVNGTTFTNVFRPGQVLFGKRRAYQRKVAVPDFSGVCSGDIYVFESRDEKVLLPEFLPFICQTDAFFEHAVATSAGSLSPRTNWKSMASYNFTLPPLQAQRRIVAVLAPAQLACEAARSAIKATRSLRMAHLDSFFQPRMEQAIPLRKAAEIVAGNTPPRANSELWGGTRYWASGKDLKTRHLDKTDETLTEEGWRLARIAPSGSTLIVVRGMILAHSFPVARCVKATAINQDLRALIARGELHADYLFLWSEWAARWFLRRVSNSSHGTKRIEGKVLGKAPVPLATGEEQMTLVSQGEAIAKGERLLRFRHLELEALRRSLLFNAIDK